MADKGEEDHETCDGYDRREDIGKIELGIWVQKSKAVQENEEEENRSNSEEQKFAAQTLRVVRHAQGHLEIGHREDKRQDEENGEVETGFLQQELGNEAGFEYKRGKESGGKKINGNQQISVPGEKGGIPPIRKTEGKPRTGQEVLPGEGYFFPCQGLFHRGG